MGGGLMQLVAYGAQDIYLTGNPQITFFKVVYRRHTNFSMESIAQSLDGIAGPDKESHCTITRNGDLLHKIYVTTTEHTIHEGSQLVNECEIEIGGQLVDKQTVEWRNIWNELTTSASKSEGLKDMQGELAPFSAGSQLNIIQLPLLFWFCRNPGLALPLIALQYHEVKLKIKWGSALDVCSTVIHQLNNNSGGIDSVSFSETWGNVQPIIYCDYIYLDTDERRRFAQVSHEYLIEQLQRVESDNSDKHNLNLNHPVKEIIWTSPLTNAYGNAKIQIKSHFQKKIILSQLLLEVQTKPTKIAVLL